MFPLVRIVLIHLLVLICSNVQVKSQAIQSCVPAGLCFPSSPDVNPRIVTPDQPSANVSACPAGFEFCNPKEGSFLCGTRYTQNISNANGPTTRGAHPWQVYLKNQTDKYIGSGVLLTSRIFLTAAHKVYLNEATPSELKIYLGVSNPEGLRQPPAALRTGSRIIIHEDFKRNFPTTHDYKDDIALVVMDRPYTMGYRTDLGLGCLPRSTDTFEDSQCMVAGWGETRYQSKDEGLVHKQVTIPVVTMEECVESMEQPSVLGVAGTRRYLDTEKELCAGGEPNKDACTEDGGAPLMCLNEQTQRYAVAGLVIWGKGCGRPGVYGVYVDVSKYTNWINSKIAEVSGPA